MDDDAQPRRRLGLWGWILIVTGAVGLAAVIGAFWLRTTSDLDAQHRRAVDLGLPMTWAGLGLDRAEGPDVRIVAEIASLAGRAQHFDEQIGAALWDPFAPVPSTCSAWQLAGGSGEDEAIDALLDRLSDNPQPAMNTATITAAIRRNDITGLCSPHGELHDPRKEALNLYKYRVAAGVDDPGLLARRLERLAAAQSAPTISAQTASLVIAGIWCNQVLRRTGEIPPAVAAASARAIADRLDAAMPLVIASQPLIHDQLLRLAPAVLFQALQQRVPEIMDYPVAMDFFFRLGRGPVQERLVFTADWCRRHGLPRSHDDIIAASPLLPPLKITSAPREVLGNQIAWGYCPRCPGRVDVMHSLLSQHLRVTTQLRLVAAELLGEAWPIDPCDPKGGRMREIRRDGRMIGAYSLGGNAIDDGGDIRADWCWPLRGQLGPRKASDIPQTP